VAQLDGPLGGGLHRPGEDPGCGQSGQPGELARVGREDQRPRIVLQEIQIVGAEVEPVGVEDHGLFHLAQQAVNQGGGFGMLAEAGADRQRALRGQGAFPGGIGGLAQAAGLLVGEGPGDHLGEFGDQKRQQAGRGSQVAHSAAGAEGCGGGQAGGAGIAEGAGDDADAAEAVLVGVGRAVRQSGADVGGLEAAHRSAALRRPVRRHADVDEVDLPRLFAPGREEQPPLQPRHHRGGPGPDRRACHRTRVGIDARGNVDRKDRRPQLVEQGGHHGKGAAQGGGGAGAEHGVDDQMGWRDGWSGDGIDKSRLAAHSLPDDKIGQGVAVDLFPRGEDPESHPAAAVGQMARHHIAVAPVIARPADNENPFALRITQHVFGQRGDAASGILHEQERGDVQFLLTLTIKSGHLGGRDDNLHLVLRKIPASGRW